MLKAGDFVYNIYLRRYFRIVEAELHWTRKNCHSLVEPKVDKGHKYRKWHYKVEPVDEKWWHFKKNPIDNISYWRLDHYSSYYATIPVPNMLYKQISCKISPGEFKNRGWRVLTKKQRKVIYTLYGARKESKTSADNQV